MNDPHIMGEMFDPAGIGMSSDRLLALAVLARNRATTVYERTSHTWLALSNDRTVWLQLSHSAQEYAKVLANRAGDNVPRGSAAKDADYTEKARAAVRKLLTTNAGQGAVGGCIVSSVNDERSVFSTSFSDIEASSERDDVLWAGGTAWQLGTTWGGAIVTPEPALTAAQPIHIRTAACAPADIPTPLFDQFMGAALPDGELRAFAMHALGVAVTGNANRVLIVLHGPNDTGKTVLARMISDVLGNDLETGYSYAPPASLLSPKADREGEAEMMGRRLVWVDEAIRESFGGTERLKSLTGGGTMTTRRNYARSIAWKPHFTLLFTSNEDPQLSDPALRARIRSIPMRGDVDAVRAVMQRIGTLETSEAWARERPGVLYKFMVAAAEYLRDPSVANNPVSVEAELEAMAREQNPVQMWLDERTIPSENLRTEAEMLFSDFDAFCIRTRSTKKQDHISMTKWARELTALGYPASRTSTARYRHLTLKPLDASRLMTGAPLPTRHDASPQPVMGTNPETTVPGTVTGSTGSVTGSTGSVTGSVTGSGANPSQTFPLVSQGMADGHDGYDGLVPIKEDIEEKKKEGEGIGKVPSYPSSRPATTGGMGWSPTTTNDKEN